MTDRPLTILAPTRYPWRFNGPRASRHRVCNRSFVPLGRLDPRIEGVTIANPWPPRRFDLVHAFNRIPIGTTPYVIGFESHLPRAYGLEDTGYFHRLQRSLASERCRGIVAISDHALAIFRATHRGSPLAATLEAKLCRRYPNLPVAAAMPERHRQGDAIEVAFVGNHFARKGGCVAVRLAEIAAERGLALRLTIASSLQMGGGIWTDPRRAGYFDGWRRRLDHPGITVVGPLPNAQVGALFARSDVALLASFGDTFGYGAIEAMAAGCPVVATRQGAFPEFIADGVDGVLLDLPTNGFGEWVGSSAPDRDTPAFERLFTDEVERLAEESFAAIAGLGGAALTAMRGRAFATARRMFDAADANRFWDDYYAAAVRPASPRHCGGRRTAGIGSSRRAIT
ncbi:glycosyltransferase family 4 protein [Sphingomonas bacterium]|uniref:glycosyltransferase family 4 protein n=1 Tax=Sphingomonas bacterium TaxID=1895847 RepID=UPI0015771494|nr:glycosyltransferase family 4 protein [Sphingomonas bacterium]